MLLARYRMVGAPPTSPVSVMVAAPHTSNWDFPLMLAMAWRAGLSPRWLGKREMFAPPWGAILRALGGVAVDRDAPGNLVSDLVAHARSADSLVLVVPVEGTRKRGEYWRSGFYRIALEADVPVVLSYLDGPSRSGGFGPTLRLTGDVKADMEPIRAFYMDKNGVRPTNKTPPRLREEDSPSA